MPEPTYLLVFFIILFTAMSAVFALAGFGAYIAPNRSAWERAFSLCFGLVIAIGFARLAIESADRIH
jgi:putative copper export protein